MGRAIRKGSRVRVRRGWDAEGCSGTAIGIPVRLGQGWTPVIMDGEEDPEFYKTAALEVYTAATLGVKRRCDR